MLRIYIGRDSVTWNHKYISKTVQSELRVAQAQLNRMLAERDL
jgi:hypothetical protein